MRKRILALALLAIIVTPALGRPKPKVHFDGVGVTKIGMSKAELVRAVNGEIADKDDWDSEGCYYISSSNYPKLLFMIEGGKLSRIDVKSGAVATDAGVRIGDSESHAKQVYGRRLKVSEHKYDEEGHYLTIFSRNGKYGIRFETHKGTIERFYAGRAGCPTFGRCECGLSGSL